MPLMIDGHSPSLSVTNPSTSGASISGLGHFAVSVGQPAAARAPTPTLAAKAKDLFSRVLEFVAPSGMRADSKLRHARADFAKAVGELLGAYKPDRSLDFDAFTERLENLRRAENGAYPRSAV